MKVRLVQMDQQARREGRGFMMKLKARWDSEFTEHAYMTAQCLRDNGNRFKRDTTLMNWLVVRDRREQTRLEVNSVANNGTNI